MLTEKQFLACAYSSAPLISGKIRGICVNCHGLNDMTVWEQPPRPAVDLAKENILYIFPYYSAWAWCGDATVTLIDELLDTAIALYDLPEDIPFVITGGSMGGLTSLMYSILGSHKPLAVGCNCPVTDLAGRFAADGNLIIRTVLSSVLVRGKTPEESVRARDPMQNIERFAKIPYLIVGGENDGCIVIDDNLVPFCDKMRAAGHDIELVRVAGMGHCNIQEFEEPYQKYLRFVIEHLVK